nr:hypothetical protein Q903MT_gene3050 [Picea sitchensis]
MEDQGLFSPCCRNGDFISRTRFPKPYFILFLGLTKPIFLTVQALARFEKRNWNFFSLFALSLAY